MEVFRTHKTDLKFNNKKTPYLLIEYYLSNPIRELELYPGNTFRPKQ